MTHTPDQIARAREIFEYHSSGLLAGDTTFSRATCERMILAAIAATEAHVTRFAREKAYQHHRIAAEKKGLRAEHIALSSAYREVAEMIENKEHLREPGHEQ